MRGQGNTSALWRYLALFGVLVIVFSFSLAVISFLEYGSVTSLRYFLTTTSPSAAGLPSFHQRRDVTTVRQCLRSVQVQRWDVSAVRESCLAATGAVTVDTQRPIRDRVNANNSCCSMFDACQFGIMELLACAPFGNGTDGRTFAFEGDDFNVHCVPRCTCTDLINCKIAVVKAFSSNHFNEAQDGIASIQHHYPAINIIIYNLGLTKQQVKNLTTSCNVHVYDLQYNRYPAHVRSLYNYAWKPIMLGEFSQDYEVIFYGDASVRLVNSRPAIDIMTRQMLKFPFVPGLMWSLPIISLTHDGMLRYLNITLSRKELNTFGHLQAGLWAVWAKEDVKKQLIKPWTDCALHSECIAPNGSGSRCDFELRKKRSNEGIYIGCHRYDQSALSMLLIREYGIGVWKTMWYKEMQGLLGVERFITYHYKVQECPP